MRTAIGPTVLDRVSAFELSLCRTCHEASSRRVRAAFAVVSRLGDGHYLYATLGVLLIAQGAAALPLIAHAMAVALVGHLLYRTLKSRTARVRPLDLAVGRFRGTVAPLDQYSFPSGHTLHAVAFAVTVSAFVPAMAWVLVPFAVLVAASRIVLGLHYPTDVVAGAALGSGLALLSLHF